jgi:hypothetical protein
MNETVSVQLHCLGVVLRHAFAVGVHVAGLGRGASPIDQLELGPVGDYGQNTRALHVFDDRVERLYACGVVPVRILKNQPFSRAGEGFCRADHCRVRARLHACWLRS